MDDPINANTMFLADKPSSSLQVTSQCVICMHKNGNYLILDQKLLSKATISDSLSFRNVTLAAEMPALRSPIASARDRFINDFFESTPDEVPEMIKSLTSMEQYSSFNFFRTKAILSLEIPAKGDSSKRSSMLSKTSNNCGLIGSMNV
jgi:hypothetical protein